MLYLSVHGWYGILPNPQIPLEEADCLVVFECAWLVWESHFSELLWLTPLYFGRFCVEIWVIQTKLQNSHDEIGFSVIHDSVSLLHS